MPQQGCDMRLNFRISMASICTANTADPVAMRTGAQMSGCVLHDHYMIMYCSGLTAPDVDSEACRDTPETNSLLFDAFDEIRAGRQTLDHCTYAFHLIWGLFKVRVETPAQREGASSISSKNGMVFWPKGRTSFGIFQCGTLIYELGA